MNEGEINQRMNQGQRLNYIRRLRGMTMKELGVALGFDESSAPVRIAQWEAGTRNPKPDAVEKMASILKFNPDRLSPSPENLVDAVIDHFLWEDDDIAASEKIRLFRFLFDFWTMRTRLQEGSITPEQYDEWKLCWPDGPSQ